MYTHTAFTWISTLMSQKEAQRGGTLSFSSFFFLVTRMSNTVKTLKIYGLERSVRLCSAQTFF